MATTLPRRSAFARRSSVIGLLGHLYGVWRQRQALKTLDAARLNDIGISRAQAEDEARRAFWDAPNNWTR